MYTSDLVETNVDAVTGGEMYAEVDEMQRMKAESNAAAPLVKTPEAYLTFVSST